METDKKEWLVLSDPEGHWYAIPREIVEKYKATDEQKKEIEETLGPDVQGYAALADAMLAHPSAAAAAANPAAMAAANMDFQAQPDASAAYSRGLVDAAAAPATAARFAPASSLATPVFASYLTFRAVAE